MSADSPLAPMELSVLEARVQRALDSGDSSGLRVLGYGEISTVLAVTAERGQYACKRLPRFDSRERFEAYERSFTAYLDLLREKGVEVLESRLLSTPVRGGGVIGYVVQPMLNPEHLATRILAASSELDGSARPLIEGVASHIENVVSSRIGLDAQLSNWAVIDGRLLYLDVTTPLFRDERGQDQVDYELFLASLPWLLRGAVRRFVAPGIVANYHDRRRVLTDLVANLYKERLERWIPAFLARVNRSVEVEINATEVLAYYRNDARMWALLQRLRRMDRWWQLRVRRRPYPSLLPGEIRR